MSWYSDLGMNCPSGCGTNHKLVWKGDEIPDNLMRLEFTCSNTKRTIVTSGIRAWSNAPYPDEDDYVEVTARK